MKKILFILTLAASTSILGSSFKFPFFSGDEVNISKKVIFTNTARFLKCKHSGVIIGYSMLAFNSGKITYTIQLNGCRVNNSEYKFDSKLYINEDKLTNKTENTIPSHPTKTTFDTCDFDDNDPNCTEE